jgi:hypothetical protein
VVFSLDRSLFLLGNQVFWVIGRAHKQ